MSTARLSASLTDRYRIERELGQGGMATVYLAHDLKHDRDVAIKVLHPDLGAALGAERFLTEIKTTAKLQHPHILPLLDSGDADGLLYYVMPLATGETLRARLERERQLPIEDAVRIAGEVADALHAAHALGIIHRDIKPENILLQGGHALVADFGIALAVQQAGGQRMTQTGLSLGTPQYMSPEQAMGDRTVDARSDIYALGAVSYEMLVGQPPFTGATVQAIVARVMTERPASIQAVRDTVSPSLEAAIRKALAKLPADRYATAAAFGAALTARRVEATPSRRRPGLPLAALLAGVVGLGAGWAIWAGKREGGVATGRITHLTADEGLEVQPAISPDGKMLAYAAGNTLRVRLYLKPVGGGRAVPLTSEPAPDSTLMVGAPERGQLDRDLPGSQQEPRWSPSGNSILFRSNGGVDTVAVGLGGGTPVTVISGAQGPVASATWSPDGRRIAFVRRDSMMSYTITTGETRFLAKNNGKECSWSPRNDWIACVDPRNYSAIGYNMGNIGPSTILLTPADGGTPVPVTDHATMNASPAWAPDGRRLYFISNRDGQRDIYYVAVGRGGQANGKVHRLTTALNAAALSLSRDGTRLAYSVYTPQANVWSVPVLPGGVSTSATATQATFGNQLVESVTLTRDGRTLFLDADRKGDSDIWRMDLGKGEPEAMTSDVADEFGGVLSPDGRRLAYYSYREGSGRGIIMVKPMDGGPLQQVNTSESYGIFPEWTPDSKALTWVCPAAPRGGHCHSTQDSAGRWRVEFKDGQRVTWSPDGRWSTTSWRGYASARGERDSVWIWPADGNDGRLLYARRMSDPSFTELQWGSDSRLLFFRSRDLEGGSLFWSLSIDGGPPRLVARLDDPARPSYRAEFATDGRRIYFTVNDRQSDISVVELIE